MQDPDVVIEPAPVPNESANEYVIVDLENQAEPVVLPTMDPSSLEQGTRMAELELTPIERFERDYMKAHPHNRFAYSSRYFSFNIPWLIPSNRDSANDAVKKQSCFRIACIHPKQFFLFSRKEWLNPLEKFKPSKANIPPGATLASQINIGVMRDVMWGMMTYRNVDLFRGKVGYFWGPTLSQMSLTALTVTLAISSNLHLVKNSMYINNRSRWGMHQFVLAFASWSSIPVWNGAQLLGSWTGEKIGLNPVQSGYFSGVFTGLAETIWQGGIVIPVLNRQRPNPLEVFLNMLSGAVWQWILQANTSSSTNVNEPYPELTVGLQIAAGVAMSTFLMTILSWRISKCCRHTTRSEDTPLTTAPTEETRLLSAIVKKDDDADNKFRFFKPINEVYPVISVRNLQDAYNEAEPPLLRVRVGGKQTITQ